MNSQQSNARMIRARMDAIILHFLETEGFSSMSLKD
jgi:hypothetical protein